MNNLSQTRRGSILLMTVGVAFLLIGLTAMVTDVGFLYYSQARLQTAVNAGWKAGFDKMAELQDNGSTLTVSEKQLITQVVLEVIKTNGFNDAELAKVEVLFPGENQLKVKSKQKVGLFFAKIFDIESADVDAGRESIDSGARFVPLAIPHGVTKDFSKNMYSCSMFGDGQGFAAGKEYILKLGSGGAKANNETPVGDNAKMILVPMDAGSQTDDGFLKAYGVAYWCLRIGDGKDTGFVPVYWLLGYRGGSFYLTYYDEIITQLKKLKVNYKIIEGADAIQAIFDAVNPNALELYDRPRIAVYSSQEGTDPVEDVLRAAYVPYGTYSLPTGYQRGVYDANANNHIYDDEILNGALDNYHWLHLHHEDFTGFNGGCGYYKDSCKVFFDNNRIGTEAAAQARMCSYCSTKYTLVTTTTTVWDNAKKKWVTKTTNSWTWDAGYTEASCKLSNTRCAERKGVNGVLYRKDAFVKDQMCGTESYLQCKEYQRLVDIAEAHGFSSDPGSEPKPQTAVSSGDAGPGMANTQAGWFNKANKVQLMKFDVVRKIRSHVEAGGFLFAQCFAPETLDITLYQAAIHDGIGSLEAYSHCFAFTAYEYRRFPIKYGVSYYSTINHPYSAGLAMPFNLLNTLKAKNQNHGLWPDTGTGHTAVFRHECLNEGCEVLGNYRSNAGHAKYISGKRGDGEFTFLGGHYHKNAESKRLVLNNILLGALVSKNVTGEAVPPTLVGKNKNNYGPIDPDNYVGGGANDYRDRFKNGSNIPVEINDRLIGESGNMAGPTDQAVDFRVNGDGTASPNPYVIIPITDVGPEVPVNNTHNVDAHTIYDLQGTDHPNGVYRPEQYNFGSSVRIIGFALFEVIEPASYVRDGNDEGDMDYQAGDAGDLGPYQTGQVRGRFIKYIVYPGEATDLLN
ncbi:MAG TPA: Tad domain-containing protein [Candidatus Rifleibacterium sp.]|nr:Tad domain-containing protein [Candidatus Rifleibacterium sp.]